MRKAQFAIDGMTCQGCVRSVTEVLKRIDGVQVEQVLIGSARVAFDPEKTSPSTIAGALSNAGFTAEPNEPAPDA